MEEKHQFCANCGHALISRAEFCANCGECQTIANSTKSGSNLDNLVSTVSTPKTTESTDFEKSLQMAPSTLTESLPVNLDGSHNQSTNATSLPQIGQATGLTSPQSGVSTSQTAPVLPNSSKPPAPVNSSRSTVTTTESAKMAAKLQRYQEKTRQFFNQYKVPLLAGVSAFIVMIVGVVLFNLLYDATELAWDPENSNTDISMTTADNLQLAVIATNKDDQAIEEINFSATAGEVIADGTRVDWRLPDETGEFTITATAPSGKKITKLVKRLKPTKTPLGGLAKPEVDDQIADNDGDGLTNAIEKELGTNPDNADSDMDGLSDRYEIEVSKTDPLKADSDDDGLRDGDELDLGLNPLQADSKGDGKMDGERILTTTIVDSAVGAELAITGKGNIASTTIDKFHNSTYADVDKMLDTVYNFHTSGEIESAEVKIQYGPTLVANKGLKPEDLTLYYLNDETGGLEQISSVIDVAGNYLTANLTHFSKYMIGARGLSSIDQSKEVFFLLDNSPSMYSVKQMEGFGLRIESTTNMNNDPEFKRIDLTQKLMQQLGEKFKFGAASFSGKFQLESAIGASNVATKIEGIQDYWYSHGADDTGTNIVESVEKSLKQFSTEADAQYLVLLTDGKDTIQDLGKATDGLINQAKSQGTKICVIGLGTVVDYESLLRLATETGCAYYSANNSNTLSGIFQLIGAGINHNYIDADGDGKIDSMIYADSGFVTSRDGFNFENFSSDRSPAGHCFGMANFAKLRYQGLLPETLSALDKNNLWRDLVHHQDLSANGYDLSNTYFTTNQNLASFYFTTPGLKMLMYDLPADYRDRVENDTWMLKEQYLQDFENIGVEITIRDRNEMFPDAEVDFSKYQSARLRLNVPALTAGAVRDDSVLLDAIWRLFITQYGSKAVSFSSDPDKAFIVLGEKLASGNPEILQINHNHAVNIVRLLQDNVDANKFRLEVYDNNYPGETRYIEITRSKFNKVQLSFTAWTNEYSYVFKYDTNNDGAAEEIPVGIYDRIEL